MGRQQLVERLEEVVAVVGIVIPGVFTVEDDADYRRLTLGGSVEDGLCLLYTSRGAQGVVEPWDLLRADSVYRAWVVACD